MPAGAIYVGRPSLFGNPFTVAGLFKIWLDGSGYQHVEPERRQSILQALKEIRDRDLVCWCGLDKDCHADTLLELANR